QYAPITLGGTTVEIIERRFGREATHFRSMCPPRSAFWRFFIKLGSHRGRPAHAAHSFDEDFDRWLALAHHDEVTRADFPSRFGRLPISQHPPLANFVNSEGARFVEARCPQPFV